MERLPLVIAMLCLSACGGTSNNTDGGSDGECLLQLGLSGALEEDLRWTDHEGCGGSSEPDTFTAVFGVVGTEINVQISVDGIGPEQTGSALAALVRVTRQDQREWETAAGGCRVDVSTNRALRSSRMGTTYLVGGSGACDQPAAPVPDDGSEPLGLSPFDYQTAILWLE